MMRKSMLYIYTVAVLVVVLVAMNQLWTEKGFKITELSKRKESIKQYCGISSWRNSLYANLTKSWRTETKHHKPRLYVSNTIPFMLCETPKCGSTQWRNLILILDGNIDGYAADSTDNFLLSRKKNFVWQNYNLAKPDHANKIEQLLSTYYKVMTTREPLERLVSAYRDKLESPSKGSPYVKVAKNIGREMNSKNPSGFPTFEEFIDFILRQENPIDLDPHWKPYSALCDPCNINYDYIAKMETIYEDADIIMPKIGVSRDRIFQGDGSEGIQDRRNSLYHKYFQRLPASKRVAIFQYYKTEYDMFDYEYPEFI